MGAKVHDARRLRNAAQRASPQRCIVQVMTKLALVASRLTTSAAPTRAVDHARLRPRPSASGLLLRVVRATDADQVVLVELRHVDDAMAVLAPVQHRVAAR